jgi:hypothetical protein
MQIKVDASAIRQTSFYEYSIRFLFGRLMTAAAGLTAKEYGPGIGGLFLTFPAIFPASATLIEKHETQKKENEGLAGEDRGRKAVAVEAVGSALGSIGLLAFALLVWKFLPGHGPWTVLAAATLAWLRVSVVLWEVRKFT